MGGDGSGEPRGLSLGEVDRRQGRGRVDDVPAAGTRLRPDRETTLLQARDVAFDRAHAHLEDLRQPLRRPTHRTGPTQLLTQGVETIDAIHG